MIMPGPAAEHGDIGRVGRHPTGGGAQGDAGSLSSGLTETPLKCDGRGGEFTCTLQ